MNPYINPEKNFSDFAHKLLEEQTTEVKKKYRGTEAAKKAARLKVFNEHLNVLKDSLDDKMSDILHHSAKNAKDKVMLEKKLSQLYDSCIADFLKKDFDK
ncbi:MAG: hypothetical protein JSS82_08400 [Bacteroidetes bacterium]|nr:hypothetical protein [Bacteroidota bacterium]